MSITILGLGPGNPAHLTREAWQVLEKADEVYLRTERHPTVASLPPHLALHSFDDLYEEKTDFAEVYEEIAARVLALGQRPQGVVYAVPGHPLVGEASVQRILALGCRACRLLIFFANPLPSYWQVVQLNLSATPSIGGIPLLILVYPPYIVLCISLSLDALRRPGPSGRVMGDLARRRARPWLVATSIVLLLISLLVAWIMFWIVLKARQRALYGVYTDMALTVAWFDLIIASLIAVVIILVGRAVISYEVFTGKTLPRHGFFRNWRSAVILATGYGAVVGWSLTLQLRPVYSLLLTTILMVVFYALFSWRSYAERENFMVRLRPFVASQRLYDQLLAHRPLDEATTRNLFHTVCRDVLGTQCAYLVPMGRLMVLTGPPLIYRQRNQSISLSPTSELAPLFPSPETRCVPVDPIRYAGASWAVSLWDDRGLAGTLLLGKKQDGGVYTQEEIEIAQASGERLLDVLAGAEMGRMVMGLLRRRIAEVKVLGGQGRRIPHDEVLPQLHAAILQLEGATSGTEGAKAASSMETLMAVHRQLTDLIRAMPTAAPHQLARHGLVAALCNLVQGDFSGDFGRLPGRPIPRQSLQRRTSPFSWVRRFSTRYRRLFATRRGMVAAMIQSARCA